MLPQQYCLRWKYHHSNLQTMFSQLLDRGCFCDVTLACEGQLIRAHRVVLCACSTFFDTVLTNYASERDPIIIMKDVTFADIKCLIEFMYKGEINVEHTNLASLLKTADDLKIKGLAEVTWRDEEDGPPLPAPQTEFHSPTLSRSREAMHYDSYGHEAAAMRSQTPELLERNNKTPSPRNVSARMPSLTPIATSSNAVSIVAAVSPSDTYMGPKRKRGRPPLDDAYDVFNVRKYADQGDHHSSFMDSSQYTRDDAMHNNHHHVTTHHSRPNSPSAAEVYQHHVQQQKQRMRYKPQMRQEKEFNEEESTAEPEWITSSMEPDNAAKDPLNHDEDDDAEDVKILPHDSGEESSSKTNMMKNEKRSKDSAAAEHPKVKALKRKSSKEESSTSTQQQRPPKTETPDEFMVDDAATVPQTVEEMESMQQQQQQQQQQQHQVKEKSPAASTSAAAVACSTSTSSSTATSSSSGSSPSASTSPTANAAHKTSSSSASSSSSTSTGHSSQHHHSSAAAGSSNSNHHGHHAAVPPPPPPPLHHPHSHPHHYGKYVPDGYLINEHGILMTHDFIHAPTATIPTSTGAASNGNHHSAADEYGDIKLEEFSEAELRLTTEEMSEWQDVIKMDDYLAKGRRPQFWEELFTRRVLDAIKNKRLEMKKAARILGVSYGTLYGRYREVYGCLKHPYSSSMRPTQASALQHRFDIVWPAPKPGQLDIGKLRPKDLSELWTRPQI